MLNPGLKSEKEFKESAITLNISPELATAIAFYQDRARKAFEQRERPWEYFDGMSFSKAYNLNRQAANSYLRPKKNDDEVRINTGTTEKKIEVVYNELLSLNLEPACRAYDQSDTLLQDLGQQWTDIVKRTNQIEKDDDFWQDAYLELLTQPAVFIKDVWDTSVVRDKRSDSKIYQRRLPQAKKVLISGLKIFLGDIRIPWYRLNEQPYIIEVDRVHWKTAEKQFKFDSSGKENPMWKYVSKGNSTANNLFSFRYGTLEEDEVEILTYYSYPDDEIQYLVNGVPMLANGSKLPWEHVGYNMKMFGLKRMAIDFAYCKPLTASAKTLQSLKDESIRLIIRKWRQFLEPSVGVKAGIVLSKDIWSPSATVHGVSKDDITVLNPNNTGITSGDVALVKLIEDKAEEFIGAGNLQQGLGSSGQQTAYEIRELQKQFVIQLGLAVLGCMAMHRDMAELRTYTLLENATEPIGKDTDKITGEVIDVYRKFTLEQADLGDGKLGTKQILFMDRDLTAPEKEDLFRYEEDQEDMGKDTRIFTINVKKLLEIPINWFWTVSQSPKDNEDLDKVLFRDSLAQAVGVAQIAGRPLAGDNIIRDFETTHKKKNWFQKTPPQTIMPPDQMGASIPGTEMKPKEEQTPSINTLQ